MKPQIEKVTAIEKYKLHVSFTDGTEGVLDLAHLSGKGVFVQWDEGDTFFKVYLSHESGAITWPNEVDIDTYNAYCKIKGISPNQYFQSQQKHAPHF
ncbi:MAG TPA: DUF2442 domain-containing protein [Flavisolibacter sp.]|nr:DUF2442 domain-containing protein [Flavisolibacter sp.]